MSGINDGSLYKCLYATGIGFMLLGAISTVWYLYMLILSDIFINGGIGGKIVSVCFALGGLALTGAFFVWLATPEVKKEDKNLGFR